MENQRNFLTIGLIAISAIIYFKWVEFTEPKPITDTVIEEVQSSVPGFDPQTSMPATVTSGAVPSVPSANTLTIPGSEAKPVSDPSQQIVVNTDLVKAVINVNGGVIERLELKEEPVVIDKPEEGYPLLKNTQTEIFTTEDGLFAAGGLSSANHQTVYSSVKSTYELGALDKVVVPLSWVSPEGVEFVKTITFSRDSYVVDINYQVKNNTGSPWSGYLYAQFKRTQPEDSGGGFGRLPSYTGGATYEGEEKYQKVDFDDMSDANLEVKTKDGWVAMIQHYFVGAWIPKEGSKTFFSSVKEETKTVYRIGFKTDEAVTVVAGQTGNLSTQVYLGSKEQKHLKAVEKDLDVEGLALTVDFGILTFIADPLFYMLNLIHSVVGNWGWSIILLTVLIKALFYPLSAASYKSMAGMKKLQPRLQTLKERHKDDRQKFQMEMMALYKKEKINPAGGCLPILVQIPVFIALYWTLLESVELRHAPFALWWQDLSAPDPYYVLPVLMGASMWAMQKLNPSAMDDIQKKVMMIMPIALTFLFLTFPQGLVLYWVVNNVLSMSQQWYINRKYAV